MSQAALFAAQIVQQQTRTIGPLPVLWPLIQGVNLMDTVNRWVPSQAELDPGRRVALLVLNRLMAPQPLDGIAAWTDRTVLPEVLGTPPAKRYDTRLERVMDALYPQRRALWQALVTRAVLRYGIDLKFIHWDTSSFYFEGAYEESELARYGYSRDHRPDTKQVVVGMGVTGRDRAPVDYAVLPGQTADVTTPEEHLERLLAFLEQPELGVLADRPVVVTDSKMVFPQIIVKYHDHDLYYLGPWADGVVAEALIRSVSEEELQAHPLAYRPRRRFPPDQPFVPYCGVLRPVTFVWEGREVGDEALIVWSAGQERLDRQKRQTLLKRLLNGLQHIQGQLNRRHYRRRDYTQEQIHRVQRGNAAASLVDVELSGTDGNLSLHFRIHRERLAATQVLDGKYVLVSNARHLSADERFTHFKGQEGVEKRLSVVKGPLRVRPTFLHRDERIEVLVWVNLVALLLYALLEKQVREAGLPYTARKVLEGFAGLGASETLFADGSHWRQADPLTVLQAEVVHRLEVPGADFYAGYEPLIVWA